MNTVRTPLGEVPLDSAQTIRRTYDDDKMAHRVVPVNEDYNIIEYEYYDNGQTKCIYFYHEADVEITNFLFTGDSSASLNNARFNINDADGNEYEIVYRVDSAAITLRVLKDSTTVDLESNDPAIVVAKATELALNANSSFVGAFTIENISGVELKITNLVKGEAIDAVDISTGFTVTNIQQGSKVLVEKLTYVYDDGRLDSITNTSGDNLLGIDIPVTSSISISHEGKTVQVTKTNELRTALSMRQENILYTMVDELRLINLHLSLMTDSELTKMDLDTKDEL